MWDFNTCQLGGSFLFIFHCVKVSFGSMGVFQKGKRPFHNQNRPVKMLRLGFSIDLPLTLHIWQHMTLHKGHADHIRCPTSIHTPLFVKKLQQRANKLISEKRKIENEQPYFRWCLKIPNGCVQRCHGEAPQRLCWWQHRDPLNVRNVRTIHWKISCGHLLLQFFSVSLVHFSDQN